MLNTWTTLWATDKVNLMLEMGKIMWSTKLRKIFSPLAKKKKKSKSKLNLKGCLLHGKKEGRECQRILYSDFVGKVTQG